MVRDGNCAMDTFQRDVSDGRNSGDVIRQRRGLFLIVSNGWFQNDSTVNWRTCQDINCG